MCAFVDDVEPVDDVDGTDAAVVVDVVVVVVVVFTVAFDRRVDDGGVISGQFGSISLTFISIAYSLPRGNMSVHVSRSLYNAARVRSSP